MCQYNFRDLPENEDETGELQENDDDDDDDDGEEYEEDGDTIGMRRGKQLVDEYTITHQHKQLHDW